MTAIVGCLALSPASASDAIRTGKTTNTIGAQQLATVWQDPEFNPDSPAVYSIMVLPGSVSH